MVMIRSNGSSISAHCLCSQPQHYKYVIPASRNDLSFPATALVRLVEMSTKGDETWHALCVVQPRNCAYAWPQRNDRMIVLHQRSPCCCVLTRTFASWLTSVFFWQLIYSCLVKICLLCTYVWSFLSQQHVEGTVSNSARSSDSVRETCPSPPPLSCSVLFLWHYLAFVQLTLVMIPICCCPPPCAPMCCIFHTR
jgi:hypothetical protein